MQISNVQKKNIKWQDCNYQWINKDMHRLIKKVILSNVDITKLIKKECIVVKAMSLS